MKVWAPALLLALSACAAPPRPAPAPSAPSPEAKAAVDRLRVEQDYRPAPQGADCVSCFIDLPPHSYVAQGWPLNCGWMAWRWDCRPAYWRRPSCSW